MAASALQRWPPLAIQLASFLYGRQMAKRHYLYTITSLVDGKRYVGLTVDPRRRWREHRYTERGSRLIRDAIEEHGIANVVFKVLVCTDYQHGCKLEQDCIRHFNTLYPHGYNLETGGVVGHTHTDEAIAAMSEAHKALLHQQPELKQALADGHRAYFADPANREKHKRRNGAYSKRKLTDDMVRHIRTSTRTNKQLAADYGVARHTISRVRCRTIWKHVN